MFDCMPKILSVTCPKPRLGLIVVRVVHDLQLTCETDNVYLLILFSIGL